MRKGFILIIILSILAQFEGKAQWSFSKEYVVTTLGDTIYGDIKTERTKRGVAKRVRLVNKEGKKRTFRPSEVKGYMSSKGYYEAIDSQIFSDLIFGAGGTVFMRRLMRGGAMELYLYEYNATEWSVFDQYDETNANSAYRTQEREAYFLKPQDGSAFRLDFELERSAEYVTFPEFPELYEWLWGDEPKGIREFVNGYNLLARNSPNRHLEMTSNSGLEISKDGFNLIVFRGKHFMQSQPYEVRLRSNLFQLDQNQYGQMKLKANEKYQLLSVKSSFGKRFIRFKAVPGGVAFVKLAESDVIEVKLLSADEFKTLLPQLTRVESR